MVVFGFVVVCGDYFVVDLVDLYYFVVEEEFDVVFCILVEVVEDDFFEGLFVG